MTKTKWTRAEVEDMFLFLTFMFDDSPHLCISTHVDYEINEVSFFCCNAETLVRYNITIYNVYMLVGFVSAEACVIQLGEINVIPEWTAYQDIRFLM